MFGSVMLFCYKHAIGKMSKYFLQGYCYVTADKHGLHTNVQCRWEDGGANHGVITFQCNIQKLYLKSEGPQLFSATRLM